MQNATSIATLFLSVPYADTIPQSWVSSKVESSFRHTVKTFQWLTMAMQ